MDSFIIILLTGVGLTNLLVNASILNKPRNFLRKAKLIDELFSCMMCSGFWVGLFLSILFGINILVGSCTVSLFSFLFDYTTDLFESLISYYDSRTHYIQEE